jgi:hypothetical protein
MYHPLPHNQQNHGLNHTQHMDYDCSFSVFVFSCVAEALQQPDPHPRNPTKCLINFETHKIGGHIGLYGVAVAQLVEALCYKPERCGFDSQWCHWNFLLT